MMNAVSPEQYGRLLQGIAAKQRERKEKEAEKKNSKMGVIEYAIGDIVLIRPPPKAHKARRPAAAPSLCCALSTVR